MHGTKHHSSAARSRRTGTKQSPGRRRLSVLESLTSEERRLYGRIPVKIDYAYDPSFLSPATCESLFGDEAPEIEASHWVHFREVPEDVCLRPRKRKTTLAAQDEATLFLRYNYARYRLAKLADAQNKRKSVARAKNMVMWFKRALHARANLVRANMALVPAMGKRTRIPNVEFAELISEGNMALLRSVEKFDVSRGFKFSTYACRAILKSFNRLATKTGRYRRHFPTEYDPKLERSDYDAKKHDMQQEDSLSSLREVLAQNSARLTEVERTILMERFNIGGGRGKGRTLAEVGKMVGLTNERVRQLQNLALRKIRVVLNQEFLVP